MEADSASNIKENQIYFLGGKDDLCAGPTTLPTSCGDRLENPGASSLACPGLRRFLYLFALFVIVLSFTPQVRR